MTATTSERFDTKYNVIYCRECSALVGKHREQYAKIIRCPFRCSSNPANGGKCNAKFRG